ncbi:MAG: hypothetical protein WDA02_02285 [Saccharofermentanales bacterium]
MKSEICKYTDSSNNLYNLYISDYISLTINGLIVFVSYQGIDRVNQIFNSDYYNYGDDLNNVSNILIENDSIVFNHKNLKNEIIIDGIEYFRFKNWLITSLVPLEIKRLTKIDRLRNKLLNK